MLSSLERAFTASKNPAIATQQAAYLKEKFNFFGLTKPVRAEIQKKIFKEHAIKNSVELQKSIEALWHKQEREFHYAAIDLAIRYKKLWTPDFLPLFDTMIRTHSWWDSVDAIAANMVGLVVKNNPNLLTTMDAWIGDDYLWTRRTALLFQLRWKEATDEQRLYAYCKKTFHEKDFFIRKAIGWALREYSKTNPASVKIFIDTNKNLMSNLSIREGSKYL
jgi:3-methyladenine DNA glycosylase AlkD